MPTPVSLPCIFPLLTTSRTRFILIIGESLISQLSGEVHTVSVTSGVHGPRRAL